jgi:hypothetical protein
LERTVDNEQTVLGGWRKMRPEELCDWDGGKGEKSVGGIFGKFLFLFLVACAKLLKATISFDMSVCLSVHPHGKIPLPQDGIL